MSNDLSKRIMYSGLVAALGALASLLSSKAAEVIWKRVFDEDPPSIV